MRKSTFTSLLLSFFFVFFSPILNAQSLTAPETHGVNGGRVLGMAVAQVDIDSVLIYISSESANSMFYTGAGRFSGFAGPVFRQHEWTVVPSLDYTDGYGSSISKIDAHDSSGYVFFIHNSILYATHPSLGYNVLIDSSVQSLLIIENYLLYVRNGALPGETWLVHGLINGSGAFSQDANSPYIMGFSFGNPPAILIDPSTHYPHFFLSGTVPQLMKIADTYDGLLSTSSITSYVNADPSVTDIHWSACGFGPDGRLFMAGGPVPGSDPNLDKYLAYTDDAGLNWEAFEFNVPGPPGGIPGNNFDFANYNSGSYELYNGAWASLSNGEDSSLFEIGRHHYYESNKGNSGQVETDPIFDELVYLTTNVGMGYAYPNGDTIYDFNDGFTAVQVFDMQMTPDFSVGFVASKSGIRKVNNMPAGADSARWRGTVFPQNDGAPYYSVAFLDTNEVYVANHRIYKTTNGGANESDWTLLFDPTLGGADAGPYNFPRYGIYVDALRVNPWDANEIMAGYNRTDGVDKGGLFVSENGGLSWSQILLEVTATGGDVNVTDVEWAIDWDGDTVCFVSVEYDAGSPQGQGVYSIKKTGGVYTSAHEVLSPYSFYDLQLSSGGDTLFAAGFDGTEAFVQMRNLSAPVWTSASYTGVTELPSALTAGDGYLFLAAENEVYMTALSGSSMSWSLGYSYPVGTEINFLFFDDLLVGTSAGLYGHEIDTNAVNPPTGGGLAGDFFGYSVDIYDQFAVVGAFGKADSYSEANDSSATMGPFRGMGSAYIYKRHRTQSNWVEWQKLLALDRDSLDGFGYAVAMNEAFVAVGAPFEKHDDQIGLSANPMDSAGAVYLYYLNSLNQYVDSLKIVAPDRSEGMRFGASVELFQDLLAIGATGDSGAVYLYRLNSSGWVFEQKLKAGDGNRGDDFGSTLLITESSNQQWLWVGAPGHDLDSSASNYLSNAGAVYSWSDSGGGMQFSSKLQAEHRQVDAAFGSSISSLDSLVLVGAPADKTDSNDGNELESSGAIYGFPLSGGSSLFKFTLSDRAAGDQFGRELTGEGNHFYVGMPGHHLNEGKVIAYRLDWSAQNIIELDRVAATDSSQGAYFGSALAVSDSTLLAGAPLASASSFGAQSTVGGAAYFFKMENGGLKSILATKPYTDQNHWFAFDPEENSSIGLEEMEEESLVVYPNPTSNYLNIETNEDYILSVYNSMGQKLLEEAIASKQGKAALDLSSLPRGLYILHFQPKEAGKLKIARVLKE